MNSLIKTLLVTAIVLTIGVLPGARAADNETGENGLPSLQQISLFTLSFTGADGDSEPTGRWWSISGGRPNIEIVTSTTGSDIHEQKRPGQMYFTDITVKGPFVKDRKAVMDWINGAASGKRERVDMTLSFLNDYGQPMSTYTLSQCIPISYQPPAVSSGNYDMLEESITFHVVTIKKMEGQFTDASPNPSDQCLFGGKFRINMDGDIPATSFSGGGVTFEGRPAGREYTITKVNWANIVIEKNAVQGDTKWKEWFFRQTKGRIDLKNVTVEYQDSTGSPARRIDFMECWPVRYDLINVDSRSGSSSAKEVIECVVGYAVYN